MSIEYGRRNPSSAPIPDGMSALDAMLHQHEERGGFFYHRQRPPAPAARLRPGESASAAHFKQLVARAIGKQQSRAHAIAARKDRDAELRRRTAVTPVVSPIKRAVDYAMALFRRERGDDTEVGWW